MNAFLTPLTAFTHRLLELSTQASLVILLVLLVQVIGGRRLAPRVRYALWLVVVARLLLPVSLESGLSLFNFTTAAPAKVFHAVTAASKAPASPAPGSAAPAPTAVPAIPASPGTAPMQAPSPKPVDGNFGRNATTVSVPRIAFPWPLGLSLFWLTGVVFLLARVIWIPLRLNAQLARHEKPTSAAVFGVLEESKRLSGVNQVLPIVQSRAVASPALLGFIRPWLLLPEGLVEKFTPQELRLVFLHELAHLKRRDIAVNWLTTLLQILHWPNPLVWVAFARMRSDRELACDELALSYAREGERQSYGHAIIKLLEGFRAPATLPGLVGILEDQTHMQRRIAMIAQFRKMTGWSAAAAALVLGIGVVTLTDAQTQKTSTPTRVFNGDGPAVKILVSGSGEDAAGMLSPDETKIGYVEWGANGGDAVLRELATGRTRNLTAGIPRKGDAYVSAGCWAPDSRSVAYSWFHDNGYYGLWIMPLDGDQPRMIRDTLDEEFIVEAWSPDGKLLAGNWWQKQHAGRSLATLDLATGVVHPLTEFGMAGRHPRFSPDGQFLVFARSDHGNLKIFSIRVAGGDPVRLTDSSAEDDGPVFSADGLQVVFSSNRRGIWDLWAVPFENGQAAGPARLVKYDFGNYPKWTTRTGKLAFTIQTRQSGAFAVDVSAIGSNPAAEPRELSKSFLGSHFSPAWSPDGGKIAYVREGKPPMLVVQTLADGMEEIFNPGMGQIQFVFWSPDGETVALRGNSRGGPGVYLYSLATRRPVGSALAVNGKAFIAPQTYPLGFSADGTEFGFLVKPQKERVALNLKTGAERKVTTPADRAWLESATSAELALYSYDTKRDGTTAYVEQDKLEQRLVIVDANNRNKRVVARMALPAELGVPRWSPDGRKLAYYVWPEADGRRKLIHILSVDDFGDHVVNTGERFMRGGAFPPTWSADSTKLAVTLDSDMPNQIGVMENLLPTPSVAAK